MNFQFKFSTPLDAFLVIFGLTVAFGCGSSMPLLCITFGDTLQVTFKHKRFHTDFFDPRAFPQMRLTKPRRKWQQKRVQTGRRQSRMCLKCCNGK